MKKTSYTMLVSAGLASGAETYRRVWVDANGEYFVKVNGETRNVTFAKNYFIKD